jgi:Protein of unknown function (DUF2726)
MGLSAVLGALGFRAHYRRQERAKRRIPRKWPLAVRSLVNSREKLVWRYLQRAFADHYIMVKAPVTRFTIPQVREESQHWFELLSAVYCTFTVCDAEGQVIGCVDVPGPQGLSLSNQTLKHTLLTQCSLRYWVIDAEQLPSVNSLRVAFLGEHAALRDDAERAREAEFHQTRANLKAALHRQRVASSATDFGHLEHDDSQLSTNWKQDSFMVPLDSRRGDLN